MDDVVVAETGRRTLRFSTLLMMLFAAVLLVGIFAMTWAVVRGLHARIDRLSEHVTAHSVRSTEARTTCALSAQHSQSRRQAVCCRMSASGTLCLA